MGMPRLELLRNFRIQNPNFQTPTKYGRARLLPSPNFLSTRSSGRCLGLGGSLALPVVDRSPLRRWFEFGVWSLKFLNGRTGPVEKLPSNHLLLSPPSPKATEFADLRPHTPGAGPALSLETSFKGEGGGTRRSFMQWKPICMGEKLLPEGIAAIGFRFHAQLLNSGDVDNLCFPQFRHFAFDSTRSNIFDELLQG
jgi:hypothetical protein